MKTPQITIRPGDSFRLGFHDTKGASRHVFAEGDGKVEKELTDVLDTSGSSERFIRSLDDPRLQGADPFTALAKSGWQQSYDQAVYGGFRMTCSAGDEAGQSIIVQGNPNDRAVVLTTQAAGLEHSLVHIHTKGSQDYSQETLIIDASPAGVPVYKNGVILFDMPSAYTGGCTT